jgi:trigger factor
MGDIIRILKDDSLGKEVSLILSKEEMMPRLVECLEKKSSHKKVPGFRSGKLPLSMAYQAYGDEAIHTLVHETVSKMSHDIAGGRALAKPLSYHIQTPFQGVALELLPDIEVHVSCSFMPEIPELDWKKITLSHYIPVPTDKELHDEMEKRAGDYLTSVPLNEKRPAKKGDTLVYTMSYQASDGTLKEVKGSFILGSNMLPPEFESALEGVSEGHVLNERLRVPKTFPDKALAGKKVSFSIIFHEIQETVPHKADEVFAQSQGCTTFDEYKEKVREDLITSAQALSEIIERRVLRKHFAEFLTFDVPQDMTERTFENLWHQDKVVRGSYDTEEQRAEAFSKEYGQSESEYKETLRQKAKGFVQTNCLLKDVIKNEDFAVSEHELMTYAHAFAQKAQTSVDQIISFWRKNPDEVEMVTQDILERKALNSLCRQCEHQDKEVSLVELKDIFEKESV